MIFGFFKATSVWNWASLFLFLSIVFRLLVFRRNPVIKSDLGPGLRWTSPDKRINSINQKGRPEHRDRDRASCRLTMFLDEQPVTQLKRPTWARYWSIVILIGQVLIGKRLDPGNLRWITVDNLPRLREGKDTSNRGTYKSERMDRQKMTSQEEDKRITLRFCV